MDTFCSSRVKPNIFFRINKEELPESPVKQARTESVLESLDEKNNEK